MFEATELKVWHQGHRQWHDLPAEFRANPPVGSKVVVGHGQTDSMVISNNNK
jgi:hypothetical protein